jgi:hypothetical protein
MQSNKVFYSIIIGFGMLLFSCSSPAQEGAERETSQTTPENKENRVSPALSLNGNMAGNLVTINYGSPKVKGRAIWGGLVPYGEVWRTGANEATTISFSGDVLVDGQLLKKDMYSLFTIPESDNWTIIFNLEEKQWGAFKYDMTADALRMQVVPTVADTLTENLTFSLLSKDNGGIIRLAWEYLYVDIPFTNAVTE